MLELFAFAWVCAGLIYLNDRLMIARIRIAKHAAEETQLREMALIEAARVATREYLEAHREVEMEDEPWKRGSS